MKTRRGFLKLLGKVAVVGGVVAAAPVAAISSLGKGEAVKHQYGKIKPKTTYHGNLRGPRKYQDFNENPWPEHQRSGSFQIDEAFVKEFEKQVLIETQKKANPPLLVGRGPMRYDIFLKRRWETIKRF